MQLSDWRKDRGWSLAKCAELFAVSHTQVMRIERGLSKPSIEAAKRIEAATNGEVTAAELLGLNNNQTGAKAVRESGTPFEAENAAVEIPVPAGLLALAREQGLDVESLLQSGGLPALKKASQDVFFETYKDAIEATNEYVRKYGTLSQRFGMI